MSTGSDNPDPTTPDTGASGPQPAPPPSEAPTQPQAATQATAVDPVPAVPAAAPAPTVKPEKSITIGRKGIIAGVAGIVIALLGAGFGFGYWAGAETGDDGHGPRPGHHWKDRSLRGDDQMGPRLRLRIPPELRERFGEGAAPTPGNSAPQTPTTTGPAPAQPTS